MTHDDDTAKRPCKRRVPASEEERGERLAELVLLRRPLDPDEAMDLRATFPVVMDTHYDTVWRYLCRRGVHEAAAEEIVLDVFMAFYQQVVQEGFRDRIPATLLGIARGKLLNHRRGEHRDPVSVGLPSSGSLPLPSGPGAESGEDRRRLLPQVRAALSDIHWAVVEALIVYEYTQEEAAELLDIPLGTVKSRLRAAMELLPGILEKLLPPSQRIR